MRNSVIENERYLAGKYLHRKDIWQCSTAVIGTHQLTKYLERLTDYTGAGVTVYPNAAAAQPANQLWYLLEVDRYDPDDLKRALDICPDDSEFLCIILLSNIKENETIQRYAEMELLTAMEDTLGELRAILSGRNNVKAIILDRLIGAEFDDIGLSAVCREAMERHTVTIGQDMAARYLSVLYVPDAIGAILTVSYEGKYGNIYNATSYYFSEYQLRSSIYTMLARHGVQLQLQDGNGTSGAAYAALSNGKLRSLGFENVCDFADALRYTLAVYADRFDLHTDKINDGYSGKLSALRTLEKDMLREIDRICRKHDIRYFICYGTMLGAVRHGGFIPWDDDIDVAMLRGEFEKFRKVAPAELDKRFSYESFTNRNGYHYFFDRVTAKDTYFASKYSDGYDMPKGISVDIFVVDNVPANEKAAYRHWKRLMRKRMLMNVRWKDTARKGKLYLLSKLLLPLLRLRSMDSYSAAYDKAVRRFEHKDTGYVMPASSDHKYRGTFKKECFEQVIPYRFDDVDTFIPVGYEEFLRAWYTEDYMKMLPLSEQNPFHDYYRLDLGSNIDTDSDTHFSFFGELKE